MPSRFYPVDAATGLLKRELGLAAITSSAYVGTQWDQGAATITEVNCIIDIETSKVSAGDEAYDFIIVGSNATNRSDGQILAYLPTGKAVAPETVDSAAGDRYVLQFITEKNDTTFRYIDLYCAISGTSPSTSFGAFFSMDVD